MCFSCALSFRALQEAQDIFGVDFDFDELADYDDDEEEMDEDVSCEKFVCYLPLMITRCM